MCRVSPARNWILVAAIATAAALVGTGGQPLAVRLPGIGLLVLVLIVRLLVWWSQGSVRRRRVFLAGFALIAASLVAAEAFLAHLDSRQAQFATPLRRIGETDASGMLVRHEACSYRLRSSMRYDYWNGQVNIEAGGFRHSQDVPLEKEPGRIRVMLTGDSSAFGWGVPDGHDLSAHLREMLNAPGDASYEVINAAVPYYTSLQELNAYQHVLRAYRPDVLIVLHGRNDLWNAIVDGPAWRSAKQGGVGRTPFVSIPPESEWSGRGSLEAALLHVALYRRLMEAVDPLPPPPRNKPPETRAWPVDQINLDFLGQFDLHRRRLAELAFQDGCTCILVLQPVVYLGKTLTALEERAARMWDGAGLVMRALWPKMREVAAAPVEGAVCVDWTDAFADFAGPAYMDECHYTPEGHRLIAERLAQVVRSLAPAARTPETAPTTKADRPHSGATGRTN
ncbi:MAG: hypothetical protein AMXMBFR13_32560 [Phycisphaerae bacterium]